jgi:hypothetical protein
MTEKEALTDSIKTLYEKWDELSVALDNLSE